MKKLFFPLLLLVLFQSCTHALPKEPVPDTPSGDPRLEKYSRAYFASGCFWCVEAIYEAVEGVEEVVSGYSGGAEPDPTYEQVSAGMTGHAETVEVYYDSTKVSYETLLKVFFDSHDPSTMDRQGPDAGRQYRSAIFYRNKREQALAKSYIDQLLANQTYTKITTEVEPFTGFFPAEGYHQGFKKRNPDNSYMQNVSMPRFNAFKRKNEEILKEEE